jgi:ABC-2 type transport system ATP-binding protein
MNLTGSSEIAAHLQHNDTSLAVRRMLDLTLEIGDQELMKEAIQWSKTYHAEIKRQADKQPTEAFYTKAEILLSKTRQVEQRMVPDEVTLLEAQNISKTYSKGNFSLHPISLSVKGGDILGIVGENGHGKTTLLRCVAGQLALDRGKLDYKLLSHPDFFDIRHHVAFIPQRIPRWYGRLKDNLHFSAAIYGIKAEANELMVDFMLERFNLSDYQDLNWNQISSGYRTRFEIARILLQRPKILILDEPLANLDINAQQTILTDFRYMAKSIAHPMGVLLSSQQLHEVEKIADNVLLIKNGHCVYQVRKGTTEKQSYALEIETSSTRESLLQILGASVNIQFNGGFYTITSETHAVQEIIGLLINRQVPISYFRDITYSTKRYF